MKNEHEHHRHGREGATHPLHHPSGQDSGHRGHEGHGGHGGHEGHDKHEGHDPKDFLRRFWVSVLLTVPVLYFSTQLQSWLGYRAYQAPWTAWVGPVLGTVLYFYGGKPFLVGALREFRIRRPGMMSLIALAISVAYLYSMAV